MEIAVIDVPHLSHILLSGTGIPAKYPELLLKLVRPPDLLLHAISILPEVEVFQKIHPDV